MSYFLKTLAFAMCSVLFLFLFLFLFLGAIIAMAMLPKYITLFIAAAIAMVAMTGAEEDTVWWVLITAILGSAGAFAMALELR